MGRILAIVVLWLGMAGHVTAAEVEVAADCGDMMTVLVLSPKDIRRAAPGMIELGKRLVVQPLRELLMKRSGNDFRSGDVKGAYDAMDAQDFDAINGRQDWANWRLIPRALSGLVPSTPVSVIDLGCGPGSSTKILGHFVHPESRLLGIDLAENLFTHMRMIRRKTIVERDRVDRSIRDHMNIIQALEAGDTARAEMLVRDHALGLADHVEKFADYLD